MFPIYKCTQKRALIIASLASLFSCIQCFKGSHSLGKTIRVWRDNQLIDASSIICFLADAWTKWHWKHFSHHVKMPNLSSLSAFTTNAFTILKNVNTICIIHLNLPILYHWHKGNGRMAASTYLHVLRNTYRCAIWCINQGICNCQHLTLAA